MSRVLAATVTSDNNRIKFNSLARMEFGALCPINCVAKRRGTTWELFADGDDNRSSLGCDGQ